jgi:peroxiredoxin
MDVALLICRLVLAAVFFVAGAAKLADRPGSREALVAFGLPSWLARPGGVLLPLLELAIAAALLPETTAWRGAVAALLLLLIFVVALAISLARGRTPDCHCFGQLHSAPASWSTIARNLVLAAAAAFVIARGRDTVGPSAVHWVTTLSGAGWATLAIAAFVIMTLAAVVSAFAAVLRQNGRLLRRVEVLEKKLGVVGTPAPAFELPDLAGSSFGLDELLAPGKPLLLVFTEPRCAPCANLLPEIRKWDDELSDRLTVAVVSRQDPESNREVAEHGVSRVLLQRGREVRQAYGIGGTPGAALVQPDGTIARPPALGAEEIRQLVAAATGVHDASQDGSGNGLPRLRGSAQPGEPAPDFRLPDVTGAFFELDDLRGHDTLMLFWNPGCPFCGAMLDDLKAWEREFRPGVPRLVLISGGGSEANRALGLHSLILLDETTSLRRPYGAPGTPAAVLVDAENKIASDVAVGAEAIFELARPTRPTAISS